MAAPSAWIRRCCTRYRCVHRAVLKQNSDMGVENFLRFSASSQNDAGEIRQSMFWLARVLARVKTVLRCWANRETHGNQRQNLHADTERNVLELGTEQLIKNVGLFSLHWAEDEVIFGQSGKVFHVMEVPSTSERYPCVDGILLQEIYPQSREKYCEKLVLANLVRYFLMCISLSQLHFKIRYMKSWLLRVHGLV